MSPIYVDRVVLHPLLEFVPKVPSCFHCDQEWTLPAFPGESVDLPFHELDFARSLRHYLQVSRECRQSPRIFVIPKDPRKGLVSPRTISNWITTLIKRAYRADGKSPHETVTTHATHGLAASWASFARVSPEVICRAVAWSSWSTFIHHYKVDPAV